MKKSHHSVINGIHISNINRSNKSIISSESIETFYSFTNFTCISCIRNDKKYSAARFSIIRFKED